MLGELQFYGSMNPELAIESFARVFDHTTFSYKFYWLEGILKLCVNHPDRHSFSYQDIVDEMIVSAFSSVAEYHLHLGILDTDAKSLDAIERAINLLLVENELFSLSRTSTASEIRHALQSLESYSGNDVNVCILKTAIDECKKQSVVYVPFRFLSSFKAHDQKGLGNPGDGINKNIEYFKQLNAQVRLPYLVEAGKTPLQRMVVIDELWRDLFLKQYNVIFDWINYQKAMYLQKLNPGVPGIVYKLGNYTGSRKLNHAKKLWEYALKKHDFNDIYRGEKMETSDQSLDHFIPWSFIANDELWNLIPTTKSMNSSKSDHLPKWDLYFEPYAHEQFELYNLIHQDEELKQLFAKCRNDNLHAIWANTDLYKPGNSEVDFMNILDKNMRPIFDAAKIQGYAEDIFKDLL